jgi:hypothetical protein
MILQAVVKEAIRLAPEEPIGLKAVLRAVETKTAKIEDIAVMATRPEEFNLQTEPMPDMAAVSTLMHEGVTCQEIMTIVNNGELPSLKLPENQWPLVQIMDKLGHSAIATQVIIQEPKLNLITAQISQVPLTVEESMDKFISSQAIGLRALLQVATQKAVNVIEVATIDKTQELFPNNSPTEEFLKIDNLFKSGVTIEEIITMGATGNLPILTAPETQKALVRLIEEQGFRATVRQV